MQEEATTAPAFVVKAEELLALNYLASNHPKPLLVEWINRGTDQKLRRSTVDMLLRTLYHDVQTWSVVRLHQTAGLRVIFETAKERDRFASAFVAARAKFLLRKSCHVTAIFDDFERADRAISELRIAGIAESAISLMSRASQFIDTEFQWGKGHSPLDVAITIAGSGVAGALAGAALLAIPGVGSVVAAGGIAASAASSASAVGGVIAATGGAIAKMLTDFDVDGVAVAYYQEQIRRGKFFVSVDTRNAEGEFALAQQIMRKNGGRIPANA